MVDSTKWKHFCMLKDLGRTCIEGRVIQRVFIAAICSLTLVGFGARSQDSVPEPAGYRVDHYRGPTPPTLTGARVLTTAEAKLYWKNGAVFVDVLAHVLDRPICQTERSGTRRCG